MASEKQQTVLPSEAKVNQLLALEVKDESGKAVKFQSLVEVASHPRVVTVFIRHFFCGFCEAYLQALAKELSAATLQGLTPPTKLVVIGCGEPNLIADYKKRTTSEYDIYADPSRRTYDALDFVTTLARPDTLAPYVNKSFLATTFNSLVNNLAAGTKMLGGGKLSQNGGEVIWQDAKPTYIYRMQNTQGHLSIAELKAQLE